MLQHFCRFIRFRLRELPLAVIVMFTFSVPAQYNDWVSPTSGNWDNAANWSSGLPHVSQLEVRIINPGNKAVVIQPSTPVNFPSSMTVQNLRVGGWPPDTNLLLMNFFGTTTPLRVLRDFVIEANGRVSMLHSGLSVSNVHLHGVFDQEGGELTFTNSAASTMQLFTGTPFMITVHAPQSPSLQPSLVPRDFSSRRR